MADQRDLIRVFLNEVLTEGGGEVASLGPLVVNRCSRSTYAYKLESQVWALKKLTQETHFH